MVTTKSSAGTPTEDSKKEEKKVPEEEKKDIKNTSLSSQLQALSQGSQLGGYKLPRGFVPGKPPSFVEKNNYRGLDTTRSIESPNNNQFEDPRGDSLKSGTRKVNKKVIYNIDSLSRHGKTDLHNPSAFKVNITGDGARPSKVGTMGSAGLLNQGLGNLLNFR
jgi:hypothetical protein